MLDGLDLALMQDGLLQDMKIEKIWMQCDLQHLKQ